MFYQRIGEKRLIYNSSWHCPALERRRTKFMHKLCWCVHFTWL